MLTSPGHQQRTAGLTDMSPGPPRRLEQRAPYAYRTITDEQPETTSERAST